MNYNFNKFDKDEGCLTLIFIIVFAIAIAFGISCLYAWCGMLLWNWVLVDTLAIAPVIEFWPMWGLVELCSILFKTHNFNNNNNNK